MGLPTLEAPGAYRKAIGVLNRPITAADAKAQALQLQLEQAAMLKVRARDAAQQPLAGAAAAPIIDLSSLASGSSAGDAASCSSISGGLLGVEWHFVVVDIGGGSSRMEYPPSDVSSQIRWLSPSDS